jgi:hypothetical protein
MWDSNLQCMDRTLYNDNFAVMNLSDSDWSRVPVQMNSVLADRFRGNNSRAGRTPTQQQYGKGHIGYIVRKTMQRENIVLQIITINNGFVCRKSYRLHSAPSLGVSSYHEDSLSSESPSIVKIHAIVNPQLLFKQ